MSDTPSVLLITPDYPPPPGGIQTIVRNIEQGLTERGAEVDVLHVDPEDYDRGVEHLLPRPRWWYSPRAAVTGRHVYHQVVYERTRRQIEVGDPDVVHAMHVREWGAIEAARAEGIPVVLSTYALELEEKALARRAIGGSDVVHAISEFTAGLVRKGVSGDPDVTIVPPSIGVESYRVEKEATRDPVPVVTMARFVDRKNLETVVRAWSRLPTAIRAGRELVVAGDGPNRQRLEEVADGVRDVRFPGWVNGVEKRRLLGAADAFAMVPRRDGYDVEGFGIVYIEAQAAGTPVVGSKHGGAPEAIGDAGIVVDDENDPDEVASALERILTDENTRRRCLDAAASRIGQFDIPAVTERHLATYERLVDSS